MHTLAFIPVALLVSLATPVQGVEVASPRLLLGEVLPNVPEPWASFDMGPSPEPLQARLLTAREITQKLRRARMPMPPQALPQRIRVRAAGRVINASELTDMVRPEIERLLPDGADLRGVYVTSGVVVTPGSVEVGVTSRAALQDGKQTLFATVRSGGSMPRRVPVQIDVSVPHVSRAAAVSRGQEVQVVVRSANVVVRSLGVVQDTGAIGQQVGVLGRASNKVIRARVVDAQTVELNL